MYKRLFRGAFPLRGTRRFKSGFTLLEICIVLVLIALFIGLAAAGLGSAFQEQALREDADKLSFDIRAAKLRSEDDHRVYQVKVTGRSVVLTELPDTPNQDADNSRTLHPVVSEDTADSAEKQTTEDQFHSGNQLWLPQRDRLHPWEKVEQASWLFIPGHLCPVKGQVRWTRDNCWLQESFDSLTGDVEKEESSFP